MKSKILEELNEIKSIITKNKNNKYIDMRQTAEYTSLSRSTIRRAVSSGELKVSRRTGKLLFDKSNVERWLNE